MQKCIPLLKVTKFLPHVFSTQRVEKLLQKSRIIPSLLSMFWILKSAFALEHRKDHQKIIIITTVGAELKCLYREMQLSWTIIELPFEVYNVSLYVCLFVFKTWLLYSLADCWVRVTVNKTENASQI